MVQSVQRGCCRARFNANNGVALSRLPRFAAQAHPVDSRCCLSRQSHCHIAKSATDVFDLVMTTCGNGDPCSRLLFNSVNRAYLLRVGDYYSCNVQTPATPTQRYIEKDGCFIRAHPPLGDTLRDTFDEATASSLNPWGISDHDRNTRETQGVGCQISCAEDHTHEATKSYFQKKALGATALWDIGTETGEIASAALVPTTKTADLSHAATQVSKRAQFKPSVLCSDTWPVKDDYWPLPFPKIQGRLGLFHYLQRLIKTMKKKHVDYFLAINPLLNAVHRHNREDCDDLLRALKEGTIGGRKHTDQDILCLKLTKHSRQRHSKHLRKEMRPPTTMSNMLDEWFVRFKCTSQDGPPPLGRLDPTTNETLFTPETKIAIKNCKEKAQCLQDPLPLEDMHCVIQPIPNLPHGLKECISRRGESSLESFHLMLAHFGNSGMRNVLADNLNLTGAARHNLAIRHRLRLTKLTAVHNQQGMKIPAGWETVVSYCNHSQLQCLNQLAVAAGINDVPFPNAKKLQCGLMMVRGSSPSTSLG